MPAHFTESMLLDFAEYERGPANLANLLVGAEPEPDVTILSIDEGHTVGVGGTTTFQVPIGLNSNGTAEYIDHKLWPDIPANLVGDALNAAILAVIEQLSLQGVLANCYALSAMNACIINNYNVLKSRIVVLPNGLLGVYGFYLGQVDQPITFTLDYNLANVGVSVGPAGFIAYKVFEKMWAFARYLSKSNSGTITSTKDDFLIENNGWMSEVFRLFGIPWVNISVTAATVVSVIESNIALGKAVTFGTPTVTTNGYIQHHAYPCTKKIKLPQFPETAIYSINPWGIPYPPMYQAIRQEDAANYSTTLCVADLSKALAVPEIAVIPNPMPPTVPVNPPPEVPAMIDFRFVNPAVTLDANRTASFSMEQGLFEPEWASNADSVTFRTGVPNWDTAGTKLGGNAKTMMGMPVGTFRTTYTAVKAGVPDLVATLIVTVTPKVAPPVTPVNPEKVPEIILYKDKTWEYAPK